eukprot:882509-Amorphochlora_amoeboformis.AAC.1
MSFTSTFRTYETLYYRSHMSFHSHNLHRVQAHVGTHAYVLGLTQTREQKSAFPRVTFVIFVRGRRTRSASIASLRSVGTIKCEEKTLDPVTLRFDDEDLEVDFSKKYNSHHFEVSTRTAAVAIFLQ